MSPPSDTQDGFALAEVLVAFALLALVTVGLMRAHAGSTGSLAAVARAEARLDLAARILEERRAAAPLVPGRLVGESDGLVWWSLAEPVAGAGTQRPPGAPGLFRVTVGAGPKGGEPPAPLLRTLVLAKAPDG